MTRMTAETVVRLPWPSAKLGANKRGHWKGDWAATRKARNDARMMTAQALVAAGHRLTYGQLAEPAKAYTLKWTIVQPKDRRRHLDDDNAESRLKAYRDGLAEALGIDDRHITATRTFAEPSGNGEIIATLRPAEYGLPVRVTG